MGSGAAETQTSAHLGCWHCRWALSAVPQHWPQKVVSLQSPDFTPDHRQDLGYPLELGYQNFLYPSEPDLRDLLLFLAERLPADASDDADQPAGPGPGAWQGVVGRRGPSSGGRDRKLQEAKRQMRGSASLSVPSSPPSASVPPHLSICPLFLGPPLYFLCVPLPPCLLEEAGSGVCVWGGGGQTGLHSLLFPPAFSSQEDTRAKRQRLQKQLAENLRQSWAPLGAPTQARDLGELLQAWGAGAKTGAAKGSRFTHSEKFTFHLEPQVQAAQVSDTPATSRRPEQDTRAAQEQELESLQEQLEGVNRNIEEVEADMKTLGVSLVQVETECRQRELSTPRVELLPDGAANLAKLQLVVESSAQRVIHLAGQWEKHRVPLLAEYRHLRKLQDCRELESSRRLAEIQELHQSVRAAAEEARRKEEVYKQLVSELETLPRDVSRLAYTQRILEIVGNIRKQKEEITKILSDTKELQKEINSLSGKLDRTFAVTDELVFKDAKKDDAARKAYKYLAALHENCSQLIQTIEDTGTIMREVRDLEEQIETEMGKKTLSNLEKIREDYRALRQENAGLLGRVREA
uniref:Coiled-coil domain-containing protein 22 n=1 Tax=Oryctolagus cuniculus TaxID=9986 RepID=A0A5F9DI59_RABIT